MLKALEMLKGAGRGLPPGKRKLALLGGRERRLSFARMIVTGNEIAGEGEGGRAGLPA